MCRGLREVEVYQREDEFVVVVEIRILPFLVEVS